ncbi:MAG: bifunctional folylpolyglutamate synthase/dihydrofolate synthase [Tannerellaceae bacterium]|jgi:dihydrofolate synthase/folylpolyglutamate synthase|nr:bifunctional folylpolyglutamate synthase/dihydrofolate synthase [Tannerellaceae bacterium]
MTYEETLHYLYGSTPVFEHIGGGAYKPGLDTSIALDNYLGNPHEAYKTIHVGGTNGKGSVCHLLAAILQRAGYKVGLYTSPHLVDFRERIRVDGEMIPKEYVTRFVEVHREVFEPLGPSFFELTSAMAFDYFRAAGVDIAVIEVGLGGRLDSTNIISPLVSVITGISKDHTQFLGDTLGEIAFEKAGIIKAGVPVVIGEMDDGVVADVFRKRAGDLKAPLFSPLIDPVLKGEARLSGDGEWRYNSVDYGVLLGGLDGLAQYANTQTVLCVLQALRTLDMNVPARAVKEGFSRVVELTGLRGRWQVVSEVPYIVLDTGHNVGAWKHLTPQIEAEAELRLNLYMIIGLSRDKDIDEVLREMPACGTYLFTRASVERALPPDVLEMRARAIGLQGEVYDTVEDAVFQVLSVAGIDDMVFVGGSNFVVADALPLLDL